MSRCEWCNHFCVKSPCERCREAIIKNMTAPLNPPEPTEEELDKIIAEQRKNLPKWWKGENPNE